MRAGGVGGRNGEAPEVLEANTAAATAATGAAGNVDAVAPHLRVMEGPAHVEAVPPRLHLVEGRVGQVDALAPRGHLLGWRRWGRKAGDGPGGVAVEEDDPQGTIFDHMAVELGACVAGGAEVKVLHDPAGRVLGLGAQGDLPHIPKELEQALELRDHHITGQIVHHDPSLIVKGAGERGDPGDKVVNIQAGAWLAQGGVGPRHCYGQALAGSPTVPQVKVIYHRKSLLAQVAGVDALHAPKPLHNPNGHGEEKKVVNKQTAE